MKAITLAILKFAVSLHRRAILAVVKAAEVKSEGATYIFRKTEEAYRQTRAAAIAASNEVVLARIGADRELADLPQFK